jgi:hypothetical protein
MLTTDDRAENANEENEDSASEDCLFFVALSRARDHLVLSRPRTRNGKATAPSSLLKGIESALKDCGAQFVVWETLTPRIAARPLPRSLVPRWGEGERPSPPTPLPPAKQEDRGSQGGGGDGLQGTVGPHLRLATPPSLAVGPGGEGRPGQRSSDGVTVPLSALEQYQRCPRQYYYQRVARLPERSEESAYLAFYECLYKTLDWIQQERVAGRTPTLEDAREQLEARWAKAGPLLENAHGRVLRQHAERMLANAYRSLPETQAILPELELVAKLPHGRVTLKCDQAERLPGGGLRLTRRLARPARKDDHTDPRLALLREAARQQDATRPIQIALSYARDGELREVPENARYEPARIARYDSALQGIQENQFEPDPDDRKCPGCPYFFICPA